MSVHRYLDACTSHITFEDAQRLETFAGASEAPLIVLTNREYGWFVHVATEPEDLQEQLERAITARMSDAFVNLLAYARSNDCNWVLLDRDAGTVDGLPTFNW